MDETVSMGYQPSVSTITLLSFRGLAFLRQFLHGYEQGQADLAACSAEAYSKTLKPYHDWVVRGVFTVRSSPVSTVLLAAHTDLLFQIACKSAVARDHFTALLAVRSEDAGKEVFERQLRSDLISCLAGIDRCLKSLDKLYNKYELDARMLAD